MCQELADDIQDVLDGIDVNSATQAELRAVVEHISELVAGEEEDDEDEDDDDEEGGDDIEVEEEEDDSKDD